MINKKILIMILCCGLSQTYWTCVSDDKGSLLDAPMGISQDEKLKPDIYIDGCSIEGMTDVGGHQGATRNVTPLTLTCYIANLYDKSAVLSVLIFVSQDDDMDAAVDYEVKSASLRVGPKERKKIVIPDVIIGAGPAAGQNFVAVYADPDNTAQSDENLSNNWSEPVEVRIAD